MKQLTCEMCGGTDLIKQEGNFVCQSCGCKYSIEEARKMMGTGSLDVSGSTVKVDTSDELEKLYQIARRAKNDENGENASKYYDMILVKDPTSWEAYFYVVYFKAMECKIAQIRSAAISVSNCLESVFTMIRDYVSEDEQYSAVNEIMQKSSAIANMLANAAKNHYDGIGYEIRSDYKQEFVDNVCAARDIMYICGKQIEYIFGKQENIAKTAAEAWKTGVRIHERILSYFADETGNKATIISYVEKIGKYDPAFAKKYINADKRAMLEKEISNLNTIIIQTPTKGSWKKIFVILAIFMIGIGVFISTLPPYRDDFISMISYICYIIGAIEIYAAVPKKKKYEKNIQIVADAKNKLKEKQAELDALK